ncbi:MAG: hypothetical protein WBI40_04565 [Methylococcaceae bacterium]
METKKQDKVSDAQILRELYDLLNDKELNVDAEKQARYLELQLEAEKRKLL